MIAVPARKHRSILLRLADSGRAGLLMLNDNVLAIIRSCLQTAVACSRFLPIARCDACRISAVAGEVHTDKDPNDQRDT